MKTILVIEDSADIQFLYQCALESENCKILVAESAIKALGLIQATPAPDLILLDLTLPDMSGDDLFTQLHKNPKLKDTKIILVSGRDDIATVAKELGSNGFLRKPFELDHLCQTVEHTLGH